MGFAMAEGKNIQWSAPEFRYYEKGPGWYWLSAIVAGAIGLFALLKRNFLFLVFVVLAELVVLAWARRKPATVVFSLSESGLTIDERERYPFERLSAFSVIEGGEGEIMSEIVLKTKNPFNSTLRLIIPAGEFSRVRAFLARFLSEVEHEETLTEYLAHLLKF